MNTTASSDLRLDRLNRMVKESIDPYPSGFKRTHRLIEVADSPQHTEFEARVAGWVREFCSEPDCARLVIEDGSARLQILVPRELLDAQRQLSELLDSGDIVGIGVRHTPTDNLLTATSLAILSKGLAPRPDATRWSSSETKYLNHEVGLLADPVRRATIQLRSKITSYIRRHLESKGFIEVETPQIVPQHVMAPVYDYALTQPRIGPTGCLRTTNTDYMRRLVAGGFDRVFQIGKNFRDEPLSFKNYPEFTMLTFGMAYATYDDVMMLVEDLVSSISRDILQSRELTFLNKHISLSGAWRRLPMRMQ